MAERLNAYTLSHSRTHAHLTALFRSALPLPLSLASLLASLLAPLSSGPFIRPANAHSLTHSASLSPSLSLFYLVRSFDWRLLSLCHTHIHIRTHTYTKLYLERRPSKRNCRPLQYELSILTFKVPSKYTTYTKLTHARTHKHALHSHTPASVASVGWRRQRLRLRQRQRQSKATD